MANNKISVLTIDSTSYDIDAIYLNGQTASHYLNYNNLSNKPKYLSTPFAISENDTTSDGKIAIFTAYEPQYKVGEQILVYFKESLDEMYSPYLEINDGGGAYLIKSSNSDYTPPILRGSLRLLTFNPESASSSDNYCWILSGDEWLKQSTFDIFAGTGLIETNNSSDSHYIHTKTFSLKTASASEIGGIKVSSVNSTAVTVNSESTTAGRYYPVELNSDGKAIVNVPWANTNTTYSIATASTAGLVKPISVITKPTLQSVTTTSGRYYSVQMSSDGNMFVNVPWSDTNTNTTYSADSGLSLSGTTFSVNTGYTTSGKNYKVQVDSTSGGLYVNVPWTDTNTVYTHPSYTARTGAPTADVAPAFGGTFQVSQPTSDGTGHVTALNTRTITIPATLSNGSGTAGLIKTSSTVTSNSGYTACPVISGVPYYKDTDTTYSAATSSTLGLVKIGSNITNSSGTISLTKSNVVDALGYTPINPSSISSLELNSAGTLKSYGGFIDFHYHDSNGNPIDRNGDVAEATPDYTSRIIENAPGTIDINGVRFKNSAIVNGTIPWSEVTSKTSATFVTNISGGSGSLTSGSSGSIRYVDSVTHTAASTSGTASFVKTINGGSGSISAESSNATGRVQFVQSLDGTATFVTGVTPTTTNVASSGHTHTASATSNTTTVVNASFSAGVLTLSSVTVPSSSHTHSVSASGSSTTAAVTSLSTSTGSVSATTKYLSHTHTGASAATTGTAVTGISGGSISVTTKYLTHIHTAASASETASGVTP